MTEDLEIHIIEIPKINKMLQENIEIEIITKITGLTQEEIEKWILRNL